MKQRTAYKKAKAFVDAQEYTIEQIINSTAEQVVTLLGLTDAGEIQELKQYYPGIQRLLIADLQDKADNQVLALLINQAQTWLEANFPAYSATKDFSDPNNRTVTIYLDGRTE